MIDKSTAKRVHEALRKTMTEFASEHHMTLERTNCTYDPGGELRFSLILNAIPEEGEATMEQRHFERHAFMFGLKPEQYGATFNSRHGTCRLVELSPRSRKYPIIGETLQTKKRYKFTEQSIATLKRPDRLPDLKTKAGSLLG
jgi:hypothetical protein